jgi:hypothetical protein
MGLWRLGARPRGQGQAAGMMAGELPVVEDMKARRAAFMAGS